MSNEVRGAGIIIKVFSVRGGSEQGAMHVNTAPLALLARKKKKHTEARVHIHKHALHHSAAGFMRQEQEVPRVKKKNKGSARQKHERSVKLSERYHTRDAHRPCMGTELEDALRSQDVWIDYRIWFLIGFQNRAAGLNGIGVGPVSLCLQAPVLPANHASPVKNP